jgi:hypothetical protein
LGIYRKRHASVDEAEQDFGEFLEIAGVRTAPITDNGAHTALAAFSRCGKDRGHSARLNLHDCFAYAMARNAGTTLLFKGDDFDKTDIGPRPAAKVKPSPLVGEGLGGGDSPLKHLGSWHASPVDLSPLRARKRRSSISYFFKKTAISFCFARFYCGAVTPTLPSPIKGPSRGRVPQIVRRIERYHNRLAFQDAGSVSLGAGR